MSLTEDKPVYTNDTENVPLTPIDITPNFNINNISEIDISSSHINDTSSISSVADSISIPATGTPSQSNNILVDKILFSTLVSKKNNPPGHTRNIKGIEDVVSIRKKVSFQNEKNKKQPLSRLSETLRRLLQIFGENEIVFEIDKCRKNIKAEKNSIYIQEYKKIVAKIEVKLVTKNDKMRQKFLKIELMSMCEDNNTVTMRPQDKTDRSEYDNNLKALENVQVLLNRFSNEKF